MNFARNTLKRICWGLVFTLLMFFYTPASMASQCDSLAACTSLYNQAILDAGTYEEGEIQPLTPIVDNSVKMVTWTSWSGYQLGQNTLGIDLWGTIVPQLQEKCQTFGVDLNLRLEQLLGLPPNNGKTKFVEMVVQSADIFRPCPNPDIQATECVQTFPANTDPSHLNWFAKTSLSSYQIPGGYPWTHLGYTYNWNPDKSEVGMSEYIIRKGSVVEVTSIIPTSDYCSL